MKKICSIFLLVLVLGSCGCNEPCENPEYPVGSIVYDEFYGKGRIKEAVMDEHGNCMYKLEVRTEEGEFKTVPHGAFDYIYGDNLSTTPFEPIQAQDRSTVREYSSDNGGDEEDLGLTPIDSILIDPF